MITIIFMSSGPKVTYDANGILLSRSFYENGKVSDAEAPENMSFTYLGMSFAYLSTRPDGSIIAGEPTDETISHFTIPCVYNRDEPEGEILFYLFNERSEIVSCKLRKDFTYKGKVISAGHSIAIARDGSLVELSGGINGVLSYAIKELGWKESWSSDEDEHSFDDSWN